MSSLDPTRGGVAPQLPPRSLAACALRLRFPTREIGTRSRMTPNESRPRTDAHTDWSSACTPPALALACTLPRGTSSDPRYSSTRTRDASQPTGLTGTSQISRMTCRGACTAFFASGFLILCASASLVCLGGKNKFDAWRQNEPIAQEPQDKRYTIQYPSPYANMANSVAPIWIRSHDQLISMVTSDPVPVINPVVRLATRN